VTCDRLEREDMLAYLGETMDPHVEACPDCRARRAVYDKIRAALASESERPVPAEWMEQTRARLRGRLARSPSSPASPLARKPSPRRALVYGGIAAVAVAAAMMVITSGLSTRADEPTLTTRVEQGPDLYRGSRHKGDILHVTASSGDARRFELRVYRDGDDLVLRCPGAAAPVCQPDGDGVKATYVFDSPGSYEVIWLTSPRRRHARGPRGRRPSRDRGPDQCSLIDAFPRSSSARG
jgi:hypothetical protein